MKKTLQNLNKPTPAKWGKIGMGLVSTSAVIAGYGLTNNIKWVGITGLVMAVVGNFLTNLSKEDGESNTGVQEQKRKSPGRPRKNKSQQAEV